MKESRMAIRMIALLSLQHMLVDFLCAYGLYHDTSLPFAGYVIYNFLAFVLQLPFGILADRLTERNHDRLLSSVMMVLAGTMLTMAGSWYAPVMAGLGNALFHVGGGILAIREDDRSGFKGAALGVFVAPGALGLLFGRLLSGSAAYVPVKIAVCVIMMLISMLIISCYGRNRMAYRQPEERTAGKALIVALLCFAVVTMRSLVGMAVSFSWKTTTLLTILSVVCVAGGKMLGGIIAARVGIRKTMIISLLTAFAGFLAGNNVIGGLLALLSFNMSMPLTLYLMARVMPDQPGAAFGLLTVALYVGWLPVAYGYASSLPPLLGAVCSLVSLAALLPAVRMCKDDLE